MKTWAFLVAVTVFAQAPTVIQPGDEVSGSRPVINQNFSNLYAAQQAAAAALAAGTGSTLIGFLPTGGTVPVTVSATLNSAFVYDIGFDTAAHACASGITVAVTKQSMWTGLSTMTCAAPLWFPTGAGVVIKPGSGQTVTLACPQASALKIFDVSLGGSISFSSACQSPAPIQWWGGVADYNGSAGTDNLAALNAATKTLQVTGMGLCFPSSGYFGTTGSGYYVSSTWSITPSPTSLSGGGQIWDVGSCGGFAGNTGAANKGAVLVFNAGGIAVSTGYVTIHDIGVKGLSGSGDLISLSGAMASFTLRNCALIGGNAAKSLVRGAPGGGGDLELIWLDNNEYTGTPSYSVPQIWFTNNAGNSALNPLRISGGNSRQIHGSATGSAPFIKMDCGTFTGCYGTVIDNLLLEVAPAGSIEWDGMANSKIDTLSAADNGTLTAPQIILKNTSSSQAINGITLINLNIAGGTSTFPDLLIDTSAGGNGAPQVTAIGGIIGVTRTVGANNNVALPLLINVRSSDQIGQVSLNSDGTIGSPYIAQWAPRLLSTNGSIGLANDPLSPRTPANGGCLAATDLVVDSANAYLVSSASHNFSASDQFLWITAGSGWTTGIYPIVSVAANKATLAKSPAATSATGGSYALNEGALAYQHGNVFSVCRNLSGTYGWLAIPTIGSSTYLLAPSGPPANTLWNITDATTNTWGATVAAGSGTNDVLVRWNPAVGWTVMAK